jgi:hypothetical protein
MLPVQAANITSAGTSGQKFCLLHAVTIGRHDRNVGGRQSHADSHADRDSDQGSSNDSDSDLEPGACDPESGYSTYPSDILSYPHDILLHIHSISIQYPDMSRDILL